VTLTGHSLIAGRAVVGEGKAAFGFNPASNEQLEPPYTLLTEDQLKAATAAAADAEASAAGGDERKPQDRTGITRTARLFLIPLPGLRVATDDGCRSR